MFSSRDTMAPHAYSILGICLSVLLFLSSICITGNSYAQSTTFVPSVNDNNLKVEPVITGLKHPVSIAFLGTNELLVVEKDTGIVRSVVNGQITKEPLLDVNVFMKGESGMLGIQTAKNPNGKDYVFLYYTAGNGKDTDDQQKNIGNRLYRYELSNNKLVNPKLLLALPKGSGFHNGGAIKIGPDGNLYIPVGDLSLGLKGTPNGTLAQNNQTGATPNLSGGILRMTQDGKPVGGIIGDSIPESFYFAYGIRNSFGIDFDPITGNTWDTENGPSFGDEINLVKPGFNSGWNVVQGVWKVDFRTLTIGSYFKNSDTLVDFNGKGKYSSPEFIWQDTVGPTAIKFLTTPKLGSQYQNDILVSDIKYGRIYHFDLNKNRTSLQLNGTLSDKVANRSMELAPVIFGQGFNGISDLDVGPDGYLYVVAYGDLCNTQQGTVYKISPKTQSSEISNNFSNPLNDSHNSKTIGNISSIAIIKNFSSQIIKDNGRILIKENKTYFSAPLHQNATFIEDDFRVINEKNEAGKDYHAGLVWQEGNNRTFYAFVRPGQIFLSDSISEVSCASLPSINQDSWNKVTIIHSGENIYVYHNDTLKMKVPNEFNGTDVSPVGIRTFNTKAEFGPIRVGQFPQNLSQLLLPDTDLNVNQNNRIGIKAKAGIVD